MERRRAGRGKNGRKDDGSPEKKSQRERDGGGGGGGGGPIPRRAASFLHKHPQKTHGGADRMHMSTNTSRQQIRLDRKTPDSR